MAYGISMVEGRVTVYDVFAGCERFSMPVEGVSFAQHTISQAIKAAECLGLVPLELDDVEHIMSLPMIDAMQFFVLEKEGAFFARKGDKPYSFQTAKALRDFAEKEITEGRSVYTDTAFIQPIPEEPGRVRVTYWSPAIVTEDFTFDTWTKARIFSETGFGEKERKK